MSFFKKQQDFIKDPSGPFKVKFSYGYQMLKDIIKEEQTVNKIDKTKYEKYSDDEPPFDENEAANMDEYAREAKWPSRY